MEIMEVAEKAEACLHKSLGETPFELGEARLYGVSLTEGEADLTFISAHEDIYELLDRPSDIAKKFDYIGVVTTGWAAPLNDNGEVDGAPSEHALRRRVRLVITANRDGVASVLRFADEPDEVVTDPGQATGSLADAIHKFVSA